ncbi:hypothetical protein AMS68_003874 [Peltaster fructicola]|uniref:Purine nucleoside phosphorylase n=1 Tax=Peltaster fructicola TaxID=286661 RepID=A0A6H0XUB6_9PEZI|nr:hypothetical protein AMS68_003874 [Peltaster fructicola]
MITSSFHRASETVEFLRLNLDSSLARPRVAIVCGSGLGGLADAVNEGSSKTHAYKDIPNFPRSTVPGHEGKLVFATMGDKEVPVVLLVGRAHFYEGHPMEIVTFAMRVCKLLGVEIVVLTNAAGGLNPQYNVGDIVCLNDHLNLAGLAGFHPLRGPNEAEFGTRFLRCLTHTICNFAKVRTERGKTYAVNPLLGADVVGMSTVPEIIAARHSGMTVLAFSLVTNKSVLDPVPRGDDPALEGMSPEQLAEHLNRGRANHEEVLEAGRAAAVDMQGLILRIVSQLP